MRPVTVATLVLLAGCDTGYGSFLQTVPVADQPHDQPVEVFLGIDGLSRAAFDEARAAGAFSGWSAADLVTFFPGVSDYSWMRLLRAGTMPGYEIQYYDPDRNTVVGAGLAGLAEHPLREGVFDPLPSYGSFDFLGDGDLWMLHGYTDPEAALPSTLDALFSTLATRGRVQPTFRGYLLNVDVVSHHGGFERAVAMLVEIDRRIREFQARHAGRFRFTILADHGNTHRRATLVDPRDLLRQVGVAPVDSLRDGGALEAVPIVHIRVNFVSLHTRPAVTEEVAARTSRHPWVDLSAAVLPSGDDHGAALPRFALFQRGVRFAFGRLPDGALLIEEASSWRALGVDLTAWTDPVTGRARVSDSEAFEATRSGPYPDLFHRVATAFTDPTVRYPATVLLSLRDDVASFGFHLPGTGDGLAVDGFHGGLSRASTLSVVASQGRTLPAAVRIDDLGALLPGLQP
jgi:hypothetical protein